MGSIERIQLKSATGSFGGVNAEGTVGMYIAEWKGHDLEEKVYPLTLRVTDRNGHVFEDRSLTFSDPAAGNSTVGTSSYPTGISFRVAGSTPYPGDNYNRSAVLDLSTRYAYLGASTYPGKLVHP